MVKLNKISDYSSISKIQNYQNKNNNKAKCRTQSVNLIEIFDVIVLRYFCGCTFSFFKVVSGENPFTIMDLTLSVAARQNMNQTPEGYISKDIYILSYIQKSPKRIFDILFGSRIF
jgi:hypothetical protein